jgi:hypothetical protein
MTGVVTEGAPAFSIYASSDSPPNLDYKMVRVQIARIGRHGELSNIIQKPGLVRGAGKYIAKDDYTHVRGSKLKRRSTRHVSEITATASEFGKSAKIIVPRSWLGRRVIAFPHSEYISKHPEERKADEY